MRKFAMDVRELDIDLIDRINPVSEAYTRFDLIVSGLLRKVGLSCPLMIVTAFYRRYEIQSGRR